MCPLFALLVPLRELGKISKKLIRSSFSGGNRELPNLVCVEKGESRSVTSREGLDSEADALSALTEVLPRPELGANSETVPSSGSLLSG